VVETRANAEEDHPSAGQIDITREPAGAAIVLISLLFKVDTPMNNLAGMGFYLTNTSAASNSLT